jgi:hypothetical protein
MARNEALASILEQLKILEIPTEICDLIHSYVDGKISRAALATAISTILQKEISQEPGLDTPELRERCYEAAKNTIIQQLDLIDAALEVPLTTNTAVDKEKDLRRSRRIISATPIDQRVDLHTKPIDKRRKDASLDNLAKHKQKVAAQPEVVVPKPTLPKRQRTSPSLSRSVSPYGWEPTPLTSSQNQKARLSPARKLRNIDEEEEDEYENVNMAPNKDAVTMNKLAAEIAYLKSINDKRDEENQRLTNTINELLSRDQNHTRNSGDHSQNKNAPPVETSTEQLPFLTYDRPQQGTSTDANRASAQWVWGDPRYPQPTQNGLFRNFKTTLYMFTFGDAKDKEMMMKWDKETSVVQYQELLLVMNVARFKMIFGNLRFEHNDGTWADVMRILSSFWPFEHLGKNLPGPDLLFMVDSDIQKKYNNGGAISTYEMWSKAWTFYRSTLCTMLPYMKQWMDEHEKILLTHWTTCCRIHKNDSGSAFASFYCFEKWYRYLIAQNRSSLFGSRTLFTEALESHNPLQPAHDELPFKGKDGKVLYAHYAARSGQSGRGRGSPLAMGSFVPRVQQYAPRGNAGRGRGYLPMRGNQNMIGRDQFRAELALQVCENYPHCTRGDNCLKQHRCNQCQLARNDLRRFNIQQCTCAA